LPNVRSLTLFPFNHSCVLLPIALHVQALAGSWDISILGFAELGGWGFMRMIGTDVATACCVCFDEKELEVHVELAVVTLLSSRWSAEGIARRCGAWRGA